MSDNTFNILMYSHDTYGLGHIRRTMAIASHLVQPGVNILILTGSPIVGRFDFPEGIDFVRIPGMIKRSNTVYVPHSIKVEPGHAMKIRKKIITATAKAFNPGMFLVDKAPLGLKKEVLPILKWFRKERPQTRVILGLRDIMDDPARTKKEWRRKKVYNTLRELYTEIWVYGDQDLFDPVGEYDIPEDIAAKMRFTGYIPRRIPKTPRFAGCEAPLGGLTGAGQDTKGKTVLVTTGGGGDGYQLVDAALSMFEGKDKPDFKLVLVTGPFLPKDQCEEVAVRAKKSGVKAVTFLKRMEKLMATADLVVSMGGYNTFCEIMSQKKPALIIPRETPRLEQLIRAQVMTRQGLIDHLRWEDLTPASLEAKIAVLLKNPSPYLERIRDFEMPGLEIMRQRLASFREARRVTATAGPGPDDRPDDRPDEGPARQAGT